MALTTEQRLDRLEEAIRELHAVLEAVSDRDWVPGSKVEEIAAEEE